VPPALADDWETCAKGAGDEAIAACTRAIKSGTYNGKTLALAYSNRGVEWRAKGDLARAHRRLRRSHQGGSAAVGRLQQPRHRPRRRRYDKAIADYDKATELNPTYASALNNRGLAHSTTARRNAPSPITMPLSRSSPMPSVSTIAAMPMPAARSTIAPSRISTRR
jgi:tetratricopeptide (TPR) repeat protein